MQSVSRAQSTGRPSVDGSLSTGGISTGLLSGGLRSFGGALRIAESVLLGSGQQTARRNAWDAVCENRRHAQDREDVHRVTVRSAH
ncbi:hypothetical protein ACEZCY_08575 [Streptacidiphilus sp. N1-12]|uniref:Uncharacterized protein n=2 Tax=Streptacidiphilus alkalitolerans TaxID=3342712 RepID=A0ABV6XDS7_9ACTN